MQPTLLLANKVPRRHFCVPLLFQPQYLRLQWANIQTKARLFNSRFNTMKGTYILRTKTLSTMDSSLKPRTSDNRRYTWALTASTVIIISLMIDALRDYDLVVVHCWSLFQLGPTFIQLGPRTPTSKIRPSSCQKNITCVLTHIAFSNQQP